jgi:hypothetical protein
MDKMFQQVLIDRWAIISFSKDKSGHPGVSVITVIYGGTTPPSPARELLADASVCLLELRSDWLSDLDPDKSGEFMIDLILAMVKFRKRPIKILEKWLEHPESYHILLPR